jgi:hypothetical protein
MTTSIMQACISEPVSWLRLETFALDGSDATVREHVAACPACKHCLEEITGDVVALPRLVVPAVGARRRPWWQFAIPAGLALAAAAILLLVIRPREPQQEGVTRIKGVGEVMIDVVRERNGTIRQDVRTFIEGDRWKVVVTCPPQHSATFEVSIQEAGKTTLDTPIPKTQLACGNRVVLPGAFRITGHETNAVCVKVNGDGTACLTLRPE